MAAKKIETGSCLPLCKNFLTLNWEELFNNPRCSLSYFIFLITWCWSADGKSGLQADHFSSCWCNWCSMWVSIVLQTKILFYLFKFLNGLGPLYLAYLLTPCVSSRSLRYVDQLLLCVLKTRLKNREGSSFVSHSSWTVQWVNSNVNEVFTPTLHIFEICLKTNFLKFQNWFCKRAFLWFL